MKDLLITGFGPWPGVDSNPSTPLAEELAKGFACDCEILPVHWERVAEWSKTKPGRYRRVLHLGVALERKTPTYELFGHNAVRGDRPGIEGSLWPHPQAVGDGPSSLGATFLSPAELLRLEMPTSYTPGDFLCDFTLYRSLARARRSRVGFVHIVPFETATQEEQLAQLVKLVELSESTLKG